MIFYGDRTERVEAVPVLRDLGARLRTIASMPSGPSRHDALVGVFIRLGQVIQGTADADRERAGLDGASASQPVLMEALLGIARALITSWESAFETIGALPEIVTPPDIPALIDVRLPEGYAFYGLHPEQYLAAVRRMRVEGTIRIIGLRSIGTGLAAVVAAALGAPAPLTVRPVGHPFERVVEVAPHAAQGFVAEGATYLIVDEGPGLSGSSFVAVSRWLEAQNVPPERIIFLPSHGGGPGAEARPDVRRRWAEARVEVAAADEVFGPEHLAEGVEALTGPLDCALEDISGGAWRSRVFEDEADWPAINPTLERRKFIAKAGGATFLVKFAGLGDEGERKLRRSRTLSSLELTPEVLGLVHGFLVERWMPGERLRVTDQAPLAQIARYLGVRSRRLSAETGGASLSTLFEMAEFNIRSELGSGAANALPRPGAQLVTRPIATDGRCDPHEWLRLSTGEILKTDALDHDNSHDLIGAQDLAWDVAGVAAEFELDPTEREHLIRLVAEAAGQPVSRQLLRFLTPCYLAFRLGAARLAQRSLGHWPEEAMRNAAAAERYAERLDSLLRGGMTEAA